MTLVIDASVVVKWLLRDPGREAATAAATALMQAVATGEAAALQPFHWLAEVAAVLSRLSPSTAAHDVTQLRALELPATDDPAVLRRACELAIRYRAHAFDTLYHAVALESSGATLITADSAYLARTRRVGQALPLARWREAMG